MQQIENKIQQGGRISKDDALQLFSMPLSQLAVLAWERKQHHSGNHVFYNRNVHIEPTNVCVNHCLFCAYRAPRGEFHAWEYSHDEIENLAKNALKKNITEIHIVGGVHPEWKIDYYLEILKRIRKLSKRVHIKAFTAEELSQMCKNANIPLHEGIELLQEAGLNSVPGGGAEIFDKSIRQKICPDKIDADTWLEVHKTLHKSGIPSNATMLYGHIETLQHRIDHLDRLRNLQDETGGFNAFIPLKYKSGNNQLSYVGESHVTDDMKTFALSRIFLDNIPHIKAYWPMIGKDNASISLAFGVDDLDGTIDDSTKIYSLAGSVEKHPAMSVEAIKTMARVAGLKAVERNSVYDIID
ncbi:MAG: CofH family radical SAM protein [Candidatus Delongbacteria bacterium]|jgi:aminodeoxyfutalosine synthase|nr:CofH family radical SAM protein [Candidatus Delongbacteria bacterium]